MKKKIVYILLASMLLSVAACGKTTGAGNGTEVVEGGNEQQNQFGTVDLCTYKGIKAERTVHEITDEEVQKEIESILDENQTNNPVERGIKDGDYVEFYFTAKVDGEVIYDFTDQIYYMNAGDEEFGADFDNEIDGAKKDDHLTFVVEYDEDYWDEQLASKKVDYDVTIDGVYEILEAELTEEFITKNLGYESEEDMRKQIKEQLQEQYDSTAAYNTQVDLLQKVIESSNVTKYDQSLYEMCAAQVDDEYKSDMEMFGAASVEEVYEMLGVTQEDVEDEILFYVYERVVVQQIADNEGISVSDDEYQKGLEEYAVNAEAESVEAYEESMGADSIRFWILEDKVMDFLEENAEITEVEGKSLEEEQGFDMGTEGIEEIDGTEWEEVDIDEVEEGESDPEEE